MIVLYNTVYTGLPALTKVSCGLLNDCIVDPIMKEFESVVADLPGVSIQSYKLRDSKYLPYQTSRAPLPVSNTAMSKSMLHYIHS